MNILEYDVKNVIIVGDIHGDFITLDWEIHNRRKITDSLIIQAGDFGVGFHKGGYYITEFLKLNDSLRKNKNTLLAVRGNHDDPSWFNGDWNYGNFKLVPDYTVINTNHGNLICIGGAASIDKAYRVEGKTWWKDEVPVYNRFVIDEFKNMTINHVVAHTNPTFCYPTVKSPLMTEDIVEYAHKCRTIVSKIYSDLLINHTILNWFNGHYHWCYNEVIQETNFITLDIFEFKNLINE